MTRDQPSGAAATTRGRGPLRLPCLPRAVAASLGLVVALAGQAVAGRGWIENPTGQAALQVGFRSTPTYEDVAETQAALTRMAAILCDATEGQVRIAQIRLVASPAGEDLAGLWLHDGNAASGGPYDAGGADLRRLGAHMDVYESARLRPDLLAHLVGHHAFGLGDQYDDQRRRGEACGVGPGFEPSALDEDNHSIMQAAGGMRCSQGGNDCLRDDQCAGGRCEAVLASEWSLPTNHDRRRGDGRACPHPSPVSRVRVAGLLPVKAEPVGPFDAKDFLTARATSVWHREIEVLGESGVLPGVKLQFWLSHLSRQQWQLSVGAEDSEFGGSRGSLRVLRTWTLAFHDDFSLASVTPVELHFPLPPTSGRGPVEVAVDIGSRSSGGLRSGEGYDGLQMIAAGEPDVDLDFHGVVGCSAPWCASSWNEADARWETAEQTHLHGGASDWETIVANHPFLSLPTRAAVAASPPVCSQPPEFLSDVMGADQVVLVLDTSRSMGLRADGRAGEVCANGDDDDDDGTVDEADCGDSRLEYQRVAVRAFLELVGRRKLQVGLVTMHTDAEVVSRVDEVGGSRSAVIEALLGSLAAEGDTAMGTALEKAQEALAEVERVGRSRTVVLLTDGASNVGVKPGQERRIVDPLRYRVFPVGIGAAADQMTLAAVAARGGGVAFGVGRASGVPAVLAEIAARHDGSAPLLGRTAFELDRAAKGAARAEKEFALDVEEYARELVVFLASADSRLDDWGVLFELAGPDGARVDEQAAESSVHRGYVVVRVSDPAPGRWRLRVAPRSGGVHRSEVVAWTSHRNADLFVDADPRLASTARPVRIAARPAYQGEIDGDLSLEGLVRRPDGSEVPVVFTRDPVTRAWGADFAEFVGRGYYEARVRLQVGRSARPGLGEPVFRGPSRALVRVVPFVREATASFYVADDGLWPCTAADCDEDGLADKLEVGCTDDVDGDGMPSVRDADSDNDEMTDGEEGTRDLDDDNLPDFCDPESTPSSLGPTIQVEERAISSACTTDGPVDREALRASLSAVRRIVQALRVHDRIAPAQRDELLAALGKVVELKKQAIVIGEVLPEFCGKYQARLLEAVRIEREIQARLDPWLAP